MPAPTISHDSMSFALVAALNRSLHSPVEMISLDDIDAAADLLAGFVGGLKADDDFRP